MFGSRVEPDLLETMKRVLRQIDLGFHGADLRGIGGVEHVQAGEAGEMAEGQRQHFRTQAGAAHAEQQNIVKAAVAHIARDLLKLGEVGELVVDDAEPTHPEALVFSGPQRGVPGPQPADFIVRLPVGEGLLDGGLLVCGQRVGHHRCESVLF